MMRFNYNKVRVNMKKIDYIELLRNGKITDEDLFQIRACERIIKYNKLLNKRFYTKEIEGLGRNMIRIYYRYYEQALNNDNPYVASVALKTKQSFETSKYSKINELIK